MQVPVFEYMRWAKRHGGARMNDLTGSSAPPLPLPPVEDSQQVRRLPTGDGDPALEARIADFYGVPADHVLFVPGSTIGNYLLVHTLLDPSAPVLVEEPVYENLPALVKLLRGRIALLPRLAADGFRVDPDRVEAAFLAGARLLLLTDLHNPSGIHLPAKDLEAIRASARRHGARILVDEVYRDFLPGAPGTAYRPDDPTVVVASSLTKVYGLGPVRAGWILVPPADRPPVLHLLDYLTVGAPTPIVLAAEAALRRMSDRRDHARAAAAGGREIVEAFVAVQPRLDWTPPDAGVVCFPRIAGLPDTEPLCRWLMEESDTGLVPGRFFGDPTRVRLGFGGDPAALRRGLLALGEALERFPGGPGHPA